MSLPDANRGGAAEWTQRVSIVLTEAQLAEVAREVSHPERGVVSLLTAFSDLRYASCSLDARADSEGLSRTVLRSLLVLAAFPIDGTYREIAKVAREVGFSTSTTHRYVNTWLALGMLERDPRSRRYRRTRLSTAGRDAQSPERSSEREGWGSDPATDKARQRRFKRRGTH